MTGGGVLNSGKIKIQGTSGKSYNLDNFLSLNGGHLVGPLTFVNNAYNVVGDDASFGDINSGGTLAVRGENGATNLWLVAYGQPWNNDANHATITYDGSNIYVDKMINGTCTKVQGVNVQFAPTDLNTCLTAGFYRLQNNHTNAAFGGGGYGQLLVVYGGADTIAQLEFQYASTTFALRVGNTVNNRGGVWTPWRKI